MEMALDNINAEVIQARSVAATLDEIANLGESCQTQMHKIVQKAKGNGK